MVPRERYKNSPLVFARSGTRGGILINISSDRQAAGRDMPVPQVGVPAGAIITSRAWRGVA